MFESLSTRIQDVFKSLRGEVRLTPEHVETALREIRLALLEADVNFKVVKAFIDRVRDQAMDQTVLKSLSPGQQVIKIVRDEMLALFGDTEGGLRKDASSPRVVLLLGLQGSGKTTTAAKLAKRLKDEGATPLLVAADTFRAAAIEQLERWAQRVDVPIVSGKPDGDPAAVVFDAINAAKARGNTVVVADTAGRLHTKGHLMDELGKIVRVAGRAREGAPDEVLLVLDGTQGQNAIVQAREFTKAANVTGLVVTKLDGTAKGGAVFAIANDLRLPVRWLGVGERPDDLVPMDARAFVAGMLGGDGRRPSPTV